MAVENTGYEPPRLTVLGTVEALTLNTPEASGSDFFGTLGSPFDPNNVLP